MSPCVSMWSVSMSPSGYEHRVSACPHVDMDMECLHVSMWILTWSVSMSPCGYGYGVSAFHHVDMDMECLHVSLCLHVSMCIRT